MMAAALFLIFGPMGFLMGFAVSEVIGYLSKVAMKEVVRMSNGEAKNCCKERTVKAFKSHLPLSRVTLLMSL